MSHKNHEEHIVVPYGTYILVWLALLILTGLTVTVAGVNLGTLSIAAAILIAIFKSLLVVNYFMNIKFESALFRNMVLVAVITLIIIIGLTFLDISFRG